MQNNILTIVIGLLISTQIFADTTGADKVKHIRQELQRIIDVNLKYQNRFHDLVSKETLNKQTPNTTIVLCSDSRVDLNTISDSPTGQLFVIRNIGNQVQTAYGSVEYGVDHLHTPILLVVGHSECGAVKAAMGDYSKESDHLRTELDTLHVDPKESLNQNIVKNVNNQIKLAVEDFNSKVNNDELLAIGMIYDLHNAFKLGSGKLIIVNVNNETDPKALSENEYLKDLKDVTILR